MAHWHTHHQPTPTHHQHSYIHRRKAANAVICIISTTFLLVHRPLVGAFPSPHRPQSFVATIRRHSSFFITNPSQRGNYLVAATIPPPPSPSSFFNSWYSRAPSSTSLATMTSDSTPAATATPPVAYRDEEKGYVYAGVAPPGWDAEKVPRQDELSENPMMDPPVPISDPYHWMRDDTRTNEKVLQHLKNENEYTALVTRHLTTTTNDNDNQETTSSDSVVTTLYNEMLSVIQESDYTTPRPHQDYMYYTRTIQDMSYKLYCRSRREPTVQNLWQTQSLTDDARKTTPVYDNEQVLLDVNQLAQDQTYCAIGTTEISPSHRYLAYTVDFTGDEICTLRIRDVTSTTTVDHHFPQVPMSGMLEWGADDTIIYYTTLDSAQRPYQVYGRTFSKRADGTPDFDTYTDALIYEDLNDSHYVSMYKSQDSKYLFIESSSPETTEIYYRAIVNDSDEPPPLQCIAKRRNKVLYGVDHYHGYWWITSNVDSTQPNMALYAAPAQPDCESLWNMVRLDQNDNDIRRPPLFDGSLESSLESITCFQNHIVACGRQDGLPQIWIMGDIQLPTVSSSLSTADPTTVDMTVTVKQFERLVFDEAAYDLMFGTHYEYETRKIVVMYDSMISPTQSIEIDLYDTTQRTVLKETIVPGYDKSLYQCERKMVLSRDGKTQIPISMVYRKDVMELHQSSNQPVPVHLYGYGSYGASMECDFVATRLPLLNRNMIYVVAHVRGGSEMGRHWYEEPNGAKYLCKMNTFYDFVDVAQYLTGDLQLTTPDLLSCEGRSAGGLLIGASINLAPELFRVAILGVPFVDVVPTMIDASIPLTAGEWEEWGNPNEIKYFQYMMDYTPTLNVKANAIYPACLLTGGLHDPRVQVRTVSQKTFCMFRIDRISQFFCISCSSSFVFLCVNTNQYWEPAKFAAALRYGQQNSAIDAAPSRPICLKIDMSAGHFSASDRYKYYKEKAFDYAFLLDQLGLVSNA